jgi:hypothetical protein
MNVTVSASQPFADGVPITISVQGCQKATKATGNATFTQFVVGFDGAYDEKNPNSGSTFNGELLLGTSLLGPKPPAAWSFNCPTNILGANAVHFIDDSNDAKFFFKNPGNYPIIIRGTYFGNFTYSQYNYSNNVIAVQSSATLNMGVRDYAIGIIIFATALIAYIDGIPYFKNPQNPPSPESEKERRGGAGIQ